MKQEDRFPLELIHTTQKTSQSRISEEIYTWNALFSCKVANTWGSEFIPQKPNRLTAKTNTDILDTVLKILTFIVMTL